LVDWGGRRDGGEEWRGEGLTDAAEEEGDEDPGSEIDEVDDVAEGDECEQGEEEVGCYVAWAVFPEDDDHGPVNDGPEGGAVFDGVHGGVGSWIKARGEVQGGVEDGVRSGQWRAAEKDCARKHGTMVLNKLT
jgi:hypothetical protein